MLSRSEKSQRLKADCQEVESCTAIEEGMRLVEIGCLSHDVNNGNLLCFSSVDGQGGKEVREIQQGMFIF